MSFFYKKMEIKIAIRNFRELKLKFSLSVLIKELHLVNYLFTNFYYNFTARDVWPVFKKLI